MGEQHQWSELETAILRQSIGKLSAREIAAELALSRNAVIGKARRLNLSLKPVKVEPLIEQPASPQLALLQQIKPIAKPPVRQADRRYRKLADMPVVHHAPHLCKWPIGGWPDDTNVIFCTKRRFNDRPYCIEHCRISYPWF